MIARRFGAFALTAVLAGVVLAAPARASALSSSQVRSLAAEAQAGNQVALGELRTVTSVDGRPANLAGALETNSAAELQGRLQALAAATPAGAASSPEAARRSAQAILAAQQFHGSPVIDPIQSALNKLGSWISQLARSTPGGPPAFWAVAGAVVLIVAAAGSRRAMRRLEPSLPSGAAAGGDSGEDPLALEREAARAEERGAFAEAVRLRFRAGLLRLSDIDYRSSLRNSEISQRLGSAQFDVLAHDFDRIAYGRAPAGRPEAEAAREGWNQVLAESGSQR